MSDLSKQKFLNGWKTINPSLQSKTMLKSQKSCNLAYPVVKLDSFPISILRDEFFEILKKFPQLNIGNRVYVFRLT